ncbi:MAG TPA: PH domain-containing protein [Solirubrobacteraceae bacterium]|nr:PH domain-containing protein [Solirubrobacteraceae bacterium]
MDPEPGEEIFFHGHPSWRSLALFYAKGLVAALLAGIVAGVVTRIAADHVQVGWVIVAVVVVFLVLALIGQIRRIQTTYSITNQRLTIQTGILSRDVHQTRLERIQNVNSSQSLFERLLRIGTVEFDTAGEQQFDFAFRGVGDPSGIVRTVDRALHALRSGEASPAADV